MDDFKRIAGMLLSLVRWLIGLATVGAFGFQIYTWLRVGYWPDISLSDIPALRPLAYQVGWRGVQEIINLVLEAQPLDAIMIYIGSTWASGLLNKE